MISREVLLTAAERYGIREEILVKVIESPPTIWDRFRIDRQEYLAAITASLGWEALADNVIYHGNAGHLLLAGVAHVLRVRVVAPMAMRVPEAMAAHGLDASAAEAYIRARDAERVAWTKFLYSVDWHDSSLYDLVVNLEKISIESTCLAIAAIVDRPEFRATPASQQALADLCLLNHVRASLFLNREVGATASAIDIRVQAGVVTVAGTLPTQRQCDIVLAAVRALPEVTSVHADLFWERI